MDWNWGKLSLRIFCWGAPSLVWILTLYWNHWGIDFCKTGGPYWPIVGSSRMAGVEWQGFNLLFYLGPLPRERWLWLADDPRRQSSYWWITGSSQGVPFDSPGA